MARRKDLDLRRKLIDVAAHEFARNGFAATSVVEVGRLAGVTKGGVYFHFRGKEELFFAAVDHWREAHRSRFAQDSAPSHTLRSFLVAYLDFHFSHPEASGLMRVLSTEMRDRFTTRVREDQQAHRRAVRSRIRELLMQGTHDGSLFTTDPAMATFVLTAAVEGVLSLVQAPGPEADPFRQPDSLVDFLLAPFATTVAYDTTVNTAPPGSAQTTGRQGVDFLPPV